MLRAKRLLQQLFKKPADPYIPPPVIRATLHGGPLDGETIDVRMHREIRVPVLSGEPGFDLAVYRIIGADYQFGETPK